MAGSALSTIESDFMKCSGNVSAVFFGHLVDLLDSTFSDWELHRNHQRNWVVTTDEGEMFEDGSAVRAMQLALKSKGVSCG